MTPDLFSPAVVLDTSVLHSAGVSSAPFQVLKGLVDAGLARVFVPELAIEEFRTQWRDKNQANLMQGIKALKSLSAEAFLPTNMVSGADELSQLLSKLNVEEASQKYSENYLKDTGFDLLPFSFEQAKEAWQSYFLGNLPSKKPKHRSDIPDAHILAAVKELTVKEMQSFFVSGDKNQRDSASGITGVTCFETLDVLVKSVDFQPLVAKWQADQKWKAIQQTLPIDEVTDRVRSFIQASGGELLSWEEVTDSQIPEDNRTAQITMFGEPDDIEINGPEDWGGGLLRYKATYFSECLLSFQVFRADAFDVPEWVSVSIGDFEKDHYFEAEGYAVVVVNVDVTVRLKVEEGIGDNERIDDISFEHESLELSLSPFE